MFKKLTVAYFSPTGGTKRAAFSLAGNLSQNISRCDLSLPTVPPCTFGLEEALLVAVPVYGGRVPLPALEHLKALSGGGTVAVTAAVYGNRAYEDALLELNNNVTAAGFRVVASCALVAQHSLVQSLANGRPDSQDMAQYAVFAQEIFQKLDHLGEACVTRVPGNHPYLDRKPSMATPGVTDTCIQCGLCAQKCPTQAIPHTSPKTTDAEKCILCMRCASICPQNARFLPEPVQAMLKQKLAPFQETRQKNELFL